MTTSYWQELEKTKQRGRVERVEGVGGVERVEGVGKEPVGVCWLPPAPGPCTTLSIQRWFYHPSSAQCRQFSFGGCQGNNNNFHTLRECEAACRHLQEEAGEEKVEEEGEEEKEGEEEGVDCLQPPDSGPCRGQLERFYYEPELEQCASFSYGGCAGNNNNFLSLADCQTECHRQQAGGETENVCLLEPDTGPCSHSQTR